MCFYLKDLKWLTIKLDSERQYILMCTILLLHQQGNDVLQDSEVVKYVTYTKHAPSQRLNVLVNSSDSV